MTSQSSRPKVAIIIATWNSAETLETTLRALEFEGASEYFWLVVDKFSTDGTTEIAQAHDVSVVYSDGGIMRAWYDGLCLSPPYTEYVMFLDSDQVLEPDTLIRLLELLASETPDMVILTERSYRPRTVAQKLNDIDRMVFQELDRGKWSASTGVAVPRVYKRQLLIDAFSQIQTKVPSTSFDKLSAHNDAIIFYEVQRQSNHIAELLSSIYQFEPATLSEIYSSFRNYGLNASKLEYGSEYNRLIRSKALNRITGLVHVGKYLPHLLLLQTVKSFGYIMGRIEVNIRSK